MRALLDACQAPSPALVRDPRVPLDQARALCARSAMPPWWLSRPDATARDALEHAAGGLSAAASALDHYCGPDVSLVHRTVLAAHPGRLRVAAASARAAARGLGLDHDVISLATRTAVARWVVTESVRTAVLGAVRALHMAGARDAATLATELAEATSDAIAAEALRSLAALLREPPPIGSPSWLAHPETTESVALSWATGRRRGASWWRTLVTTHPTAAVATAALDAHPTSTGVARAVLVHLQPEESSGAVLVRAALVLLAAGRADDSTKMRLRRVLAVAPAAPTADLVSRHGVTLDDLVPLAFRTHDTATGLAALHDAVADVVATDPERTVAGSLEWARLVLVHPHSSPRMRTAAADYLTDRDQDTGEEPGEHARREQAMRHGPEIARHVPLPALLDRTYGPGAAVLTDQAVRALAPAVDSAEMAAALCALCDGFTGTVEELVTTARAIAA